MGLRLGGTLDAGPNTSGGFDLVARLPLGGEGQKCLRLTAELSPQVVLMDVRMPRMDGNEATRRLVAAGSNGRVLMLTTFDLDELVYAALAAGASGFLLKDVPREQLVGAVRMVARRRGPLPGADPAPRGALRGGTTASASHPTALRPLSRREVEVFAQLARGRSKLDLRDRVPAVVLAYEIGYLLPGQPPD
ncbi:MAG: response regulator transcription factor [Ornithinibacter sp.]